jgi:glutamyl-tRNA reductase
MARATSERLSDNEVAVFARRSVQVGHRQVLGWDEAEAALQSYPVVISTYPGKAPMPANFRSALRKRTEPLLLIDLGMPPAFAPGGDLVRYVGIDELAAVADARPSPAVDETLKEDARKSWQRLETPARTSEVIAALTAVADQAADEEVARFAGRFRSAEDPESILRQLAHTVARRVVHPPISYLRSSPAEAVEVLADAFGVESE